MIPELLLEQLLSGEKDKKDYYSRYGKENIENALEKLKQSNEGILKSYPAEKMQDEIFKKLEDGKSGGKKRVYSFSSPVFRFAAAAAVILAAGIPLFIKTVPASGVRGAETASQRVKGALVKHHELRLYREENNTAVRLINGGTAHENDLIQITYLPSDYTYGVIFSVDGNSNITRHFPEDSWMAGALEKTGEEVPLSFSYSLDDAPSFECFIFVASKREFDLKNIEELSHRKTDIDFLKKGTYLPEGCDGTIFVLNKE